MKNYITWLKIAVIFQLLAAAMHSISLFINLPPNNETEKQLFNLMDTYKFDFGMGFHPTMAEIMLVFSTCLCLLCLLSGLLNWYLIKKKVDAEIMKGVININLIVFAILFGLTATFTFLVPIIQIGLIVVFLVLSRITIRSIKEV